MKKYRVLLFCALFLLLFSGCGVKPKEEEALPYVKEFQYSNLKDQASQEEVAELLTKAGVKPERVENFLKYVRQFNESVDEKYLVSSGFSQIDPVQPPYDVDAMQEQWMKKHPDFIGHNCRITAFGLSRSLVDMKQPYEKNTGLLLVDAQALEQDPTALVEEGDLDAFENLFSAIATEATQDVKVHLSKVQQDWKKRGIRFVDNPAMSLITVFFHDDLEEQPQLFIGHTGILLTRDDGKLYFIEKVAFQEPYQLLLLNNRTELNDYLMRKYDVTWGQSIARPFIMENQDLMAGYRSNPENIGEKKN